MGGMDSAHQDIGVGAVFGDDATVVPTAGILGVDDELARVGEENNIVETIAT